MSKFLNADDTVDLIKSGVGALDEKNNYRQIDFPATPPQQGSVYIWVTIPQKNYTVNFNYFAGTTGDLFSINWGDGSVVETITATQASGVGALQHTYKYKGQCVVEIIVINTSSNTTRIGGGTDSTQVLTPATIIDKIAFNTIGRSLRDFAFYNATNLTEVQLQTENANYGFNAKKVFSGCTKLSKFQGTGLSLPVFIDNTSTPDNTGEFFGNCQQLNELSVMCEFGVPKALTYNCRGLKKLTIKSAYNQDAATKIENMAFYQCDNLQEIHFENFTNPPTLGTNVFYPSSVLDNLIIYVPKGTLATWKAATGWSTYADRIVEEGAFDKLSTTGGALTGDVTTTNTTFTSTSLVTKQYVDDTIANLNANATQY